MCGIFGGFGLENITKSNIDYITNSFSFRGPDDLGSWVDKNINFVLLSASSSAFLLLMAFETDLLKKWHGFSVW